MPGLVITAIVEAAIAIGPSLLLGAVVSALSYGLQAALAPNPRKQTLSDMISKTQVLKIR